MSTRILVVVGALVAVVVGALLVSLALQPSGAPTAQNSSSSPVAPPSAPEPDPTTTASAASAGKYVDYTDTAIAEAEGTTLLFFHAPWCPQCRSVEDDILSMGVPSGVTIIKVDYDSRQDLRQQYGVTLQTTFVEVDSSGAGKQTYVAYDDPRLQAVLDAML